ncbi:MAG: hypothetical protein MJZ07_07520 [Bacteroidales bacterium]|nr:hypothetical protein [Bacteroidales bacterium]
MVSVPGAYAITAAAAETVSIAAATQSRLGRRELSCVVRGTRNSAHEANQPRSIVRENGGSAHDTNHVSLAVRETGHSAHDTNHVSLAALP